MSKMETFIIQKFVKIVATDISSGPFNFDKKNYSQSDICESLTKLIEIFHVSAIDFYKTNWKLEYI